MPRPSLKLSPPQPSPEQLAILLHAGRHEDLVQATCDWPGFVHEKELAPYITGALVFLGRELEAVSLHNILFANSTGPAQPVTVELSEIASLFYLAIGHSRHGKYDVAKTLLSQIARRTKLCPDADAKFYLYQAFGFFKFFSGRYRQALSYAERALNTALSSGFFSAAFSPPISTVTAW